MSAATLAVIVFVLYVPSPGTGGAGVQLAVHVVTLLTLPHNVTTQLPVKAVPTAHVTVPLGAAPPVTPVTVIADTAVPPYVVLMFPTVIPGVAMLTTWATVPLLPP